MVSSKQRGNENIQVKILSNTRNNSASLSSRNGLISESPLYFEKLGLKILYDGKSNGAPEKYNPLYELHGVSNDGSTRRIDMIAFQDTNKGWIIDPTIRMEYHADQPIEVLNEKCSIYNATISHYKNKYQLKDTVVLGLMRIPPSPQEVRTSAGEHCKSMPESPRPSAFVGHFHTNSPATYSAPTKNKKGYPVYGKALFEEIKVTGASLERAIFLQPSEFLLYGLCEVGVPVFTLSRLIVGGFSFIFPGPKRLWGSLDLLRKEYEVFPGAQFGRSIQFRNTACEGCDDTINIRTNSRVLQLNF
ncbi:hypothetical protein C0J52_26847 [Blattella germanica]|nr:hypothetical protein C0J52_26847 [Blattella germanica]